MVEDWRPYVTTDPALLRPVDALCLVGDPARAARVEAADRLHPFHDGNGVDAA